MNSNMDYYFEREPLLYRQAYVKLPLEKIMILAAISYQCRCSWHYFRTELYYVDGNPDRFDENEIENRRDGFKGYFKPNILPALHAAKDEIEIFLHEVAYRQTIKVWRRRVICHKLISIWYRVFEKPYPYLSLLVLQSWLDFADQRNKSGNDQNGRECGMG